jgi:hypothetical protein
MSTVRERLLEQHAGQEVTVHLQRNGSDLVYTGVLEQRTTDKKYDPYWVIKCKRQATPDPKTKSIGIIPATEVKFLAEDFWYLVVASETREEAAAAVKEEFEKQRKLIETPGAGGIVTP